MRRPELIHYSDHPDILHQISDPFLSEESAIFIVPAIAYRQYGITGFVVENGRYTHIFPINLLRFMVYKPFTDSIRFCFVDLEGEFYTATFCMSKVTLITSYSDDKQGALGITL